MTRVFAALLTCLLTLLSAAGPACAQAEAPAPETRPAGGFPLRDGDVWVMIGDSITWQNLYAVYLEAAIRARYPNLRFATVNSGRSGECFIQGVVRFRGTVASYKPTVISICYGMNDHSKTYPLEQDFVEDSGSAPNRLLDLASGTGSRVLIFSAPPLLAPESYATDGGKFTLTGKASDAKSVPPGFRSNPVSRKFAGELARLAQANNLRFIDQMAPLQQIWGMNFGRDRVASMRNALRPVIDTAFTADNYATQAIAMGAALKPFLDDEYEFNAMLAPDKANLLTHYKALRGAKAGKYEEFRAYLQGWIRQVDDASPPFVQLSGYTDSSRVNDIVHPNEAGHLHMAGVLFRLLGGEGLVGSATIDAPRAKVVATEKSAVRDVAYRDGVLTFKRLDASIPVPIEPKARPGLEVDVETPVGSPRDFFGMSRCLLTVTGLPAGTYEVLIDDYPVAKGSEQELAAGIDVGLARSGPLAEQSLKLLAAVRSASSMAITPKDEPAPERVAVPRVFEEALPVEHAWKVRRR